MDVEPGVVKRDPPLVSASPTAPRAATAVFPTSAVSGPASFNAVHDHGTADWSFVYYVRAGDGAGTQGDGGCLLLRTQLRAARHEYAYVAVQPVPGELWASVVALPVALWLECGCCHRRFAY